MAAPGWFEERGGLLWEKKAGVWSYPGDTASADVPSMDLYPVSDPNSDAKFLLRIYPRPNAAHKFATLDEAFEAAPRLYVAHQLERSQ